MHRAYLEETNPLLLNHLILTGELHSYLADLSAQAQKRERQREAGCAGKPPFGIRRITDRGIK